MTATDLFHCIYQVRFWGLKYLRSCGRHAFIVFIIVEYEEKGFRLEDNLEALKITPEYQVGFNKMKCFL